MAKQGPESKKQTPATNDTFQTGSDGAKPAVAASVEEKGVRKKKKKRRGKGAQKALTADEGGLGKTSQPTAAAAVAVAAGRKLQVDSLANQDGSVTVCSAATGWTVPHAVSGGRGEGGVDDEVAAEGQRPEEATAPVAAVTGRTSRHPEGRGPEEPQWEAERPVEVEVAADEKQQQPCTRANDGTTLGAEGNDKRPTEASGKIEHGQCGRLALAPAIECEDKEIDARATPRTGVALEQTDDIPAATSAETQIPGSVGTESGDVGAASTVDMLVTVACSGEDGDSSGKDGWRHSSQPAAEKLDRQSGDGNVLPGGGGGDDARGGGGDAADPAAVSCDGAAAVSEKKTTGDDDGGGGGGAGDGDCLPEIGSDGDGGDGSAGSQDMPVEHAPAEMPLLVVTQGDQLGTVGAAIPSDVGEEGPECPSNTTVGRRARRSWVAFAWMVVSVFTLVAGTCVVVYHHVYTSKTGREKAVWVKYPQGGPLERVGRSLSVAKVAEQRPVW